MMKKIAVAHGNNFSHELPLIGFGAMGISEFYGTTDQSESRKAINLALEKGINHFDTADGYAYGDNERFLNSALHLGNKQFREKLIVASKAGILRDKNDPSVRGININPDYLLGQLEKSLKNLETDYLDIFYIHRLPPTASEQELTCLSDFLLQTKIKGTAKAIGLSEPKLAQLKQIHHECPISFVQSEYSLLERTVEKNGILDFCRKEHITFVAYSPLCRGMLTDSFHPSKLEDGDFRRTLPRFMGENFSHNWAIIEELRSMAKAKGFSLSSLAIAWLLSQGVVPIPGMRKASRVVDAVNALDIQLSQNDLHSINEIASINAARGTRYAPAAMQAYGFE